MAKRTYSAISKFKRVEASMREATNGFRDALGEIDIALAGPRTDDEIALLRSFRDQVAKVRDDARAILHRLYSEVDSRG